MVALTDINASYNEHDTNATLTAAIIFLKLLPETILKVY